MAKPNFNDMSEEEAKTFIFEHIKKRFTKNGPMLGKLPKDCRDDALNEVFLDLWNNRFNYDPNLSDFTTYAYNRGRGVVKSMLQAHGRIGRVRKKITLENRKGYLNQSLESENKEICNALMSLLSVEERRILGMRFLQDIPVNEIAQNLNLNPQKIYAIIREAKLKCITSKWNLE